MSTAGAGACTASVVVPTWNRADELAACLAGLLAQRYPADDYEIVVVDDGSTQHTRRLVEAVTPTSPVRVVYVRQPHAGVNAARNLGIEVSSGRYLLFVDDDCQPPAGWLEAFVAGLRRHPEASCAGGPIRWRFEGPAPPLCPVHGPCDGDFDEGLEEGRVDVAFGGNLGVPRAVFERVGPFDERLSGWGDELEWLDRLGRAGGTIVHLPGAMIWHRRGRAELRLRTLVAKSLRRGGEASAYFALVGRPVRVGSLLGTLSRQLGHAFASRCTHGLTAASFTLGLLWSVRLGLRARRGAGRSGRRGSLRISWPR